jgi:hypothetical protein
MISSAVSPATTDVAPVAVVESITEVEFATLSVGAAAQVIVADVTATGEPVVVSIFVIETVCTPSVVLESVIAADDGVVAVAVMK